MASRTQIVCLCEGIRGQSIDGIFINKLIRTIRPAWVRLQGTNYLRIEPCGGRSDVIARMPSELRGCLAAGGDTTLMVWSDCDDSCADGEALKAEFWKEAQRQGIGRNDFDRVVFIFAKDRLENWIEFLTTGRTDESIEGSRVKNYRNVAEAAKNLAELCKAGKPVEGMPPSLQWSCGNWRALAERLK